MARPADIEKDRELIEILTANARTPLAEIARKPGVSRATLRSRLGRLERDGVIAGYTTLLGKRSEAIQLYHATKRTGLLRRFAPLRKRFAFVAGNDDSI